METLKVEKYVKQEQEYQLVYEATSSDMVRHTEEETVADHIDRDIFNEKGVHGVRYNRENDMIEFFDSEDQIWVPIAYVGTYLLTDDGEIICTRAGEKITLI